MAHWHLPEAATTRTIDVTPVLSLERMREPGDVLAVPVVVAHLAVLAQVFLAKRAFDILQVLQSLVALSFCGRLGCLGVVALSRRCSELSLELGNSVLEAGAVGNETVHHVGVLLGGGVGGSHDLCVSVCERAVCVGLQYVWLCVCSWVAVACVIRLCRSY
eukprot:COSAG03_NODE_2782_length_2455_cov_2.421902_3_plen_161_part_00